MAAGTVTAVPEHAAAGYWPLSSAGADGTGTYLGSEMAESLAELATADLTILDSAGLPITVFDWMTARRATS